MNLDCCSRHTSIPRKRRVKPTTNNNKLNACMICFVFMPLERRQKEFVLLGSFCGRNVLQPQQWFIQYVPQHKLYIELKSFCDWRIINPLLKFCIQIYHSMFEKRFLEETRQMYCEEGGAKKHELEVPDFLLHAEKRMTEEQDRCLTCMDHSTL